MRHPPHSSHVAVHDRDRAWCPSCDDRPSIVTGGATTVGEVGGFVIEPEIAVPVLTVALTGALLFCL